MGYIEKELLGTYFINHEFQRIYEATSKDFQNLVTLEKFIELGTRFNEGTVELGNFYINSLVLSSLAIHNIESGK